MPKQCFFLFLQNCRDVKNEVFEKKMSFLSLSFYVAARETENMEKAQKTLKMIFFEGGYPKMRKMKKWGFSRN